MEGLTLTLGTKNGKLVLDYGFKGYTHINIEKIPNLFNLRDILQTVLMRETITDKAKNFVKDIFDKYNPFQNKKSNHTQHNSSENNGDTRPYRSIHIPINNTEKHTTNTY